MRIFFTETAERAVKTFCQTALGMLGVGGIGIMEVDWVSIVSVSMTALVISVLTSIVTLDRAPASAGPGEVQESDGDATPEEGDLEQ